MSATSRMAKRLQKQVVKKITQTGLDIVRVRPAHISIDGERVAETRLTVKGRIDPLSFNEVVPFADSGMMSLGNPDEHQCLFTYTADVLETDMLEVIGMRWRVVRMMPVMLGTYVIVNVANCHRVDTS